MRAIVMDCFGEPRDVLQLREIPAPKPGPGQVLIRMLASPINPSDLLQIRGRYANSPQLPTTPGFEGVGVVIASGGGFLAHWLQGKRVALINRANGNWCEQTVVPATQTVPVSRQIAVEQAATFFVNPMTAFAMTRRVLNIPRDAWLLQTAAGSALGRMVIRLGERFGFRTINVVRRTDQISELKAIGATHVIACSPDALTAHVHEITSGSGVHYAIDPVGGATAAAVVRCLATGGRLLLFGTLSDEPMVISPRDLMTPGASIEGFWLARWMQRLSMVRKLQMVRAVGRLIRDGVLATDIGQVFNLEEVVDAVVAAESPGRTGKILLRISDA